METETELLEVAQILEMNQIAVIWFENSYCGNFPLRRYLMVFMSSRRNLNISKGNPPPTLKALIHKVRCSIKPPEGWTFSF